MNYSRQRELILDTLKKNALHPTAEKLYTIIKEEHPDSNIGIATVYRNLKKMSEKGTIKKISGLDESEHFDHNTHNHYHFICEKCKTVFDIECSTTKDIIENIQNQTSFIITGYDIVFHGICKECQSKNEQKGDCKYNNLMLS